MNRHKSSAQQKLGRTVEAGHQAAAQLSRAGETALAGTARPVREAVGEVPAVIGRARDAAASRLSQPVPVQVPVKAGRAAGRVAWVAAPLLLWLVWRQVRR